MKHIRLAVFAGVLVILLWATSFSKPVASQQIESRLTNLEADINRLESQLNSIQSQFQNRPSGSSRTTLTPPQSSRRRNMSQQERDKMFDRLATLVVELKQQVNQLQARVVKLESRR